MLNQIMLRHVGPAPGMRLEFGPRLTLLTGDNGLGKTFALDIAWRALTGSWPGPPALPTTQADGKPTICFSLDERWLRYAAVDGTLRSQVPLPVTLEYDPAVELWHESSLPEAPDLLRLPVPALVLYARVDGSFSVWDPIRSHQQSRGLKAKLARGLRQGDHFSTDALWNGLEFDGKVVCNGLIRDWCTWQDRRNEAFEALTEVVRGLSPSPQRPMLPGQPQRLSIEDVREIPTIELPYATVPLTLASAGMRRIISLAYLLVWACREHRVAADLAKQAASSQLVLLIDEVEAHLHPQWQRTLLPSVITVAKRLAESPEFEADVQVIATTHAPLVLASMETQFDEGRDRVLTFETHNGAVSVREVPWAKQGDAVGWLVSDVFGMQQARSREAEQAIEAAEALMRGDTDALPPDLRTREAIHQKLVEALPDHDPFWPRWVVDTEKAHS